MLVLMRELVARTRFRSRVEAIDTSPRDLARPLPPLKIGEILASCIQKIFKPSSHLHPPLQLPAMAAASDKARFYLEQYVPELQEYARKELFTPDEITAISRKRSDFEHVLNARGSKPSDYAKYAVYEMNLSTLVKKRCKRMGVKQGTNYSGQRTVFFILERGTKKFPGDMGLWMQYIQFCQKQKASKKLAKVFTSVLRLKPRDWNLWVLAAKHYAEGQGDMATARSYMQRGLRFCKEEKRLWIEYVRLEMVYLAKLAARRKILGLHEERKRDGDGAEKKDEGADVMMLPSITAEDIDPEADKGMQEVDAAHIQRLSSAPAFTGAIPIAIFDAAMKQFKNNKEVAEEIFEVVASFDQVPSARKILQHILDHMRTVHAVSEPEILFCEARLSIFGIVPLSSEFPVALGPCLVNLGKGIKQMADKKRPRRAEKAAEVLLRFCKLRKEMNEDVMTVIESKMREFLRSTDAEAFAARLRKKGREEDAAVVEGELGITRMDES